MFVNILFLDGGGGPASFVMWAFPPGHSQLTDSSVKTRAS